MNGLILYTSEDGTSRIQLRADGQTVWLSQLDMAELFQTSKQNIAKHLKAIFADGELHADSVVNQWLTTAADGKNYRVAHYNLGAILAVGYRVRSPRGVQFRQWASTALKEYPGPLCGGEAGQAKEKYLGRRRRTKALRFLNRQIKRQKHRPQAGSYSGTTRRLSGERERAHPRYNYRFALQPTRSHAHPSPRNPPPPHFRHRQSP